MKKASPPSITASTATHETLVYRLATILSKLNRGESLDPKELAEELGVNLRTIQRDLNKRFMGIPLVKIKGRYQLDPADSAHLGKLSLRDVKRFSVFSGISQLFPDNSENFLQKIITSETNPNSNSNSAWRVLGQDYEDLQKYSATFTILEKAILETKLVQFRYTKGNGETRIRDNVEPYKLINKEFGI
jgi:predicted DNA-binding transcriptional regulator YafY